MAIPAARLLEICVPSTVFLGTNIKKVENGETARGAVVFAQGAKIAEAITKYNDSTAKTASEAYNVFGKYAEKSRMLDYAGKGINWATHNVNPLICVASGYKVLKSDDKVHTGITQLGAISGMFLGEGLMKQNMDKFINPENVAKLGKWLSENGLKTVGEYLTKNAAGGKISAIAKGIAFVCASLTSYDIGEKIAKPMADEVCTNLGLSKPKEQNPQQQTVDNPITPDSQKIDRMV